MGYISMYINMLLSLAVYGSDIYTAIVLLAFDRWSSDIQPFVPFSISRWIFGGCIILSILLLIYEAIVAYGIYKGRNIALNYTNPTARNFYSVRGYRYFCLFAKITKSKSTAEYIALFVYFTLKGWVRLLFAESPRQVLNALTLYSVLKINDDFVGTIRKLASNSLTEAVVLGFMAFSLLIWVINVIFFLAALLCFFPIYINIDSNCSGLEEYCCLRINKRIRQLVDKYSKKDHMELKEANNRLEHQPTLPTVNFGEEKAPYTVATKSVSLSQDDLSRHNTSVTSASSTNTLVSSPPGSHLDDSRTGHGYMKPTNNSKQSLLMDSTRSDSFNPTEAYNPYRNGANGRPRPGMNRPVDLNGQPTNINGQPIGMEPDDMGRPQRVAIPGPGTLRMPKIGTNRPKPQTLRMPALPGQGSLRYGPSMNSGPIPGSAPVMPNREFELRPLNRAATEPLESLGPPNPTLPLPHIDLDEDETSLHAERKPTLPHIDLDEEDENDLPYDFPCIHPSHPDLPQPTLPHIDLDFDRESLSHRNSRHDSSDDSDFLDMYGDDDEELDQIKRQSMEPQKPTEILSSHNDMRLSQVLSTHNDIRPMSITPPSKSRKRSNSSEKSITDLGLAHPAPQ